MPIALVMIDGMAEQERVQAVLREFGDHARRFSGR